MSGHGCWPKSGRRPACRRRSTPRSGTTNPTAEPGPEQVGLVPQHREIADRLSAVGQYHCQIAQHPTRRMCRPPAGGAAGIKGGDLPLVAYITLAAHLVEGDASRYERTRRWTGRPAGRTPSRRR